MLRSLLVCLLLLSTVGPAIAADILIPGNRMRLVDLPSKRGSQMISYAKTIDLSGMSPSATGGKLEIFSMVTGQQMTLNLAATQWTEPRPGRRVRFDAVGNPGIKVVVVDGRMVRVVVKGSSTQMMGLSLGTVGVRLTIGPTRFCAVFGGTISADDGTRFVSRGAPAPMNCPAAPND